MHLRALTFVVALIAFTTAGSARAEDPVAHARRSQTTGIVLTSVGGSLVVSAPIVVFASLAYVSANPYSSAALGPMFLGAIGGGAIGLGLLVPGLVMLATCKAPKKERMPTLPETKQPAWSETRPVANGMRTLTIPLLRGTF